MLVAAFTVGGAAFSALFLMRDTPRWIVLAGAAASALVGGLPLLARVARQAVAVFALYAMLTLAGLLIAARVFAWGLHAAGAALVTALVGFGTALVYGPPLALLLRLRRRASHDAVDRALVGASLWLGLVTSVFPLLNELVFGVEGHGFAYGGLTRVAQGLALLAGGAFAAAALARDAGRLRFLAGVRAGRLPAWEIAPRAGVEAAGEVPIVYLAGGGDDGVLMARVIDGEEPFRSGNVRVPLALVPLDATGAAQALRRRLGLALGLTLAQGGGALALAIVHVRHLAPLSGVSEVSLGLAHTCVRLASGRVACWGMNRNGQVGDGSHRHRSTPVAVEGLDDATQIAAGSLSTCALRRGGRVACWGQIARDSARPVAVPLSTTTSRIVLGDNLACALSTEGRVACWGVFHADRWDTGAATNPSLDPVLLDVEGERVLDLAVSQSQACIRTERSLRCLDHPNRPRRDDNPRACPTAWTVEERNPETPPGRFTGDLSGICEATREGRVRCWGPDASSGSLGQPRCRDGEEVPGPTGVRQFVRLHRGTCALDDVGVVRCWDSEGRGGQPILDQAVGLSSGFDTTCAARQNGSLWCWGGTNDYGELGDGTRHASELPVQVRR